MSDELQHAVVLLVLVVSAVLREWLAERRHKQRRSRRTVDKSQRLLP